jgi:hypothetical protein
VDIVAVEQLDRVSNDETVMVGEIASSAADHADVANPAIEPLNPAAIRTALKQARVITGFLVGAIVDQASGVAREATMVTNPATFGLDFELAGRMNASWLAQILALYGRLGHGDLPDDIVVSTPLQLHLIHSIPGPAGAFLYLVFDRKVVNLALMQRMVNEIARTLVESME